MTTSNTITYTETATQICSDALSLLAILAAGETISSADLTYCVAQMEKMLKAWMAQGIHLWTEESGTIFFVNGQAQYNLQAGASGTQASDGTGTPVETTVLTAATNGTSTISVTTITGMTSGDTIGVCQDNNTILWTTINGAPSGTTVTLTSPTTSTAAAGNAVYTYTNQLPRVLSIQSARLRNNSGFDKMMEMRAREDYMRIPEKSTPGDPIICYYSPQITNGQVFLWPAPNDVNKRLEITYLRSIQDVGSTSNNLDVPVEWLEAVTYNLALRVASAYGISLSSGGIGGNPDLLRQAAQYLDDLKAWDTEQPYIQIVPKSQFYPK